MEHRSVTRSTERGVGGTPVKCVLLADRHHDLAEGIRGLLETTFDAVVMVADATSLFESVNRLKPDVSIVDLSIVRDEGVEWMTLLRRRCPEMKLVVISVHDEPSVQLSVLAAGADGFVVKRNIATELLTVVDSVMAGQARCETGRNTD